MTNNPHRPPGRPVKAGLSKGFSDSVQAPYHDHVILLDTLCSKCKDFDHFRVVVHKEMMIRWCTVRAKEDLLTVESLSEAQCTVGYSVRAAVSAELLLLLRSPRRLKHITICKISTQPCLILPISGRSFMGKFLILREGTVNCTVQDRVRSMLQSGLSLQGPCFFSLSRTI